MGISLSTIPFISSISFMVVYNVQVEVKKFSVSKISLSDNQHEPRATNHPHSRSYQYMKTNKKC